MLTRLLKRPLAGSAGTLSLLTFIGFISLCGTNRMSNADEPEARAMREPARQIPTASGVDQPKFAIERLTESLLTGDALIRNLGTIEALDAAELDIAKNDIGKYVVESPLKAEIAGRTSARDAQLRSKVADVLGPLPQIAFPNDSVPAADARIEAIRALEGADVADVGKGRIEAPIKVMFVQEGRAPAPDPTNDVRQAVQPEATAEKSADTESDTNPYVEPGKVSWHEDFESACAASRESGKPVLLFQLLGQLDQRFT